MATDEAASFAFMVAAYNHQDYILEHLESIKYLVIAHGNGRLIDLVISDDHSKDNTRHYIDHWIEKHRHLFRSVKTIYNAENIGTCSSVYNMLREVDARCCKLTAGDDVYSYENIFEISEYHENISMASGLPLHLFGSTLHEDKMCSLLATATQIIYRNDPLLHRFKHFSYNNAPNIIYSTPCVKDPNVVNFMQKFDVTEDWPLQIAIAREYPEHKFALVKRTLVYYRRTPGSTFIVANRRFRADKLKIYSSLIEQEKRLIEKIRLRGRMYCFQANNRIINKFLNMDLYFFIFACLASIRKITAEFKGINLNTMKHQEHYLQIKQAANDFKESIGTSY